MEHARPREKRDPMTDDLSQHPYQSKHAPIQMTNHPSGLDGVQLLFRFDNNYGASVIHTAFSYGIEAALIRWEAGAADDDFTVVDDHEMTPQPGIFPYLDLPSLENVLDAIKNLPSISGALPPA